MLTALVAGDAPHLPERDFAFLWYWAEDLAASYRFSKRCAVREDRAGRAIFPASPFALDVFLLA
jgi:hypothetical protein